MPVFPFSAVRHRLLMGMVAAGLVACQPRTEADLQGYIEGEYLYMSAPQGGYLQSLDSPRGSRVNEGQPLFTLAADPDRQQLEEAQARASAAQERARNLQTAKRPAEIASLQAALQAAQAQERLTQAQLQTQNQLAAEKFVSPLKRDEAQNAHDQARAQVSSLQEQLKVAQSAIGRDAEVRAAQSDASAAQASADQKRWLLEHKTVKAPATGEVSDSYYRPGEWVPAGAPVLSLLPDPRRRLRFFVPQAQLASLRLGQTVQARCDGCKNPITGQIDFIAAQAEYTPPVIYSKGSREKLVFRVEAAVTPEQAAQLRPGLPIDVRLSPP